MKEFIKKNYPEILIVLTVLLVYARTLGWPFLAEWDDHVYVTSNPRLDFTAENLKHYLGEGPLGLWTPFTMYSLMLDHLVWGVHAFGYRLTNLLLQCASAFFFARILRRLGLRDWLVLFCGLCWAVHPQRVESVVWISERKDVLSVFFALGAFLVFQRGPEKPRNLIGALVLILCGVFSKPSVVGMPLVCAVYACWSNPEKFRWRTLAAGTIGVAAACAVVAAVMHWHPNFEPLSRILSVVPHNILFYSAAAVLPFEMNPCYPFVDWTDGWLVPAFVVLTGSVIYFGRRAGLSPKMLVSGFAGFGAVFLLFFLPASGAIDFNPTDYADRYGFLPSLAVWSGSGFFLERILRRRPGWGNPVTVLAVILCILCVLQTVYYIPVWKDDLSRVRYAVRNARLPNDTAATSYGKLGMLAGDSAVLREAADALACKQDLPDYPRNPESWRVSRRQTILMFLALAEAYDGNTKQANLILREFLKERRTLRFYSAKTCLPFFKGIMLRQVFLSRDDALLLDFIDWAASEKSYRDYGAVPVDYTVEGFQLFLKKDYPGAIAVWRKGLAAYPGDRDLSASIERTEKIMNAGDKAPERK